MSDGINEIAAALAKAQGQMRAVAKDRENSHLHNRYATLASVIDAVRQPLADNGIAFVQLPTVSSGMISVETRLLHSSGQSISAVLSVPSESGKGVTTVQALGSAITYLRRYGLMALAGVAPGDEEDDDGEAAPRETRERTDERPKPDERPLWAREVIAADGEKAAPDALRQFCIDLGKLDPPLQTGTATKPGLSDWLHSPDGAAFAGYIAGRPVRVSQMGPLRLTELMRCLAGTEKSPALRARIAAWCAAQTRGREHLPATPRTDDIPS